MRSLFAGLVALALGAGGCAAVTGLGEYTSGSVEADGSASKAMTDGLPTTDAGFPTGEVDADLEASTADDADGTQDDSSSPGNTPADGAACGPQTCSGCCMNGACVVSQAVTACGVGGRACLDCTSEGACSNGTCVTPVAPVKDAGSTATCNASQCPQTCIPVYQAACCTASEACGCQVIIPSKGTCSN